MSRDAWLPDESADFISDINGFTVTDAFFAADERYNQGQTPLLHWIGRDAEGKVYSAADFHPSWPCPTGWITVDGGKTIRQPEGKTLKQNSYLGHLAKATYDLTKPLEGTPNDPLANFNPTEAQGYIGLTFDLEEVEVDFGKVGMKTRLMPVRFGGAGSAPAAVAAAPVAAVGSTPTAPAGLEAQVFAIAAAAESYEAFQGQALTLPGVVADGALVSKIIDREATGIYAQANGA